MVWYGHGMVRYGMIWSWSGIAWVFISKGCVLEDRGVGMVYNGMVWCGMVWYDHGIAWCLCFEGVRVGR